MRHLLRATALLAVILLVLPGTTATPAAAFGDTCYRDVKATGSAQRSMGAARSAAQAAWETAVARRYGSRFSNWYYSADRTFQCSWDVTGTRITCVAIAGACGRKR